MPERKKLADILLNSDREKLGRDWDSTKAADDLKPLPSGEYRCSIASGELFNAKQGTPGYKLKLVVLEGEHADRVVWHDVWLTEAALPMAKRDLGKLGITEPGATGATTSRRHHRQREGGTPKERRRDGIQPG